MNETVEVMHEKRRVSFKEELEDLINKHSIEEGSDTADYILAEYLVGCLVAFDKAVLTRRGG